MAITEQGDMSQSSETSQSVDVGTLERWRMLSRQRGLSHASSIRFGEFMILWNISQNMGTPKHHRHMGLWLEREGRAAPARLVMMAFRGAGKSTLIAVMCAWMLLRYPERRILILSATAELATRMSVQIRAIIERHPLTAALMHKQMRSWSRQGFRVATDKAWRDDSVVAEGVNATITGMRADIVIGDDIETPENVGNARMMQQLRQKLAELEYIVTPKGTIIFIGTPHGPQSLYDPEYRNEYFDTHSYTRLVVPVMDTKGNPVWAERFSAHRIGELKRRTSSHKFRAQMLLDPYQENESGLSVSRLQWYDADLEYREANRRAVFRLLGLPLVSGCCVWDPAFGRRDGCASTIACVVVDANGIYYLHDVLYLAGEESEEEDMASAQCRQIVDFARRNFMPHVYVENNGLGQFLPGLLRRVFRETSGGEAVTALTARTTKDQRILSAYDTILAARRLYVNERLRRSRWLEELQTWKPGHKQACDGIDAAAHCLLLEPVRFGAHIPSSDKRPLWRMNTNNTALFDKVKL